MNTQLLSQRSFMIGDSWLYYKIYTGYKTADRILTEVIAPLMQELLDKKVIEKWFFLRYSDPRFHIRIRLHFKDSASLMPVITAMNEKLAWFIKEELIWKVQLDEYHRELDRYGSDTIEDAESIFFHDSLFVVKLLSKIEGHEGEQLRWFFGFRGIDSLLDSFGYSLHQKLSLMEMVKASFAREFGMSRLLKKQLDEKYREVRKKIDYYLSESLKEDQGLEPLLRLLKERALNMASIAFRLRKLEIEQSLGKSLDEIVASYIHMFMNRLFRSQNRKYELVLYDFIYRAYNSQVARLKHQKSN